MVSRECPRIIYLPQFIDERGKLTVCEGDLHVPFEIKRVFWIFDVPEWAARGDHSHVECNQVIIAVHGAFMVRTAYAGNGKEEVFYLDDPHKALYVPKMTHISIYNFLDDAVCLVICSEHYMENDYVRQVQQFEAISNV